MTRSILFMLLFLPLSTIAQVEEANLDEHVASEEIQEQRDDSTDKRLWRLTGTGSYFLPDYGKSKMAVSSFSIAGNLEAIAFIRQKDGTYILRDNFCFKGTHVQNDELVVITDTRVFNQTKNKTILIVPPSTWVNVSEGEIEKCTSSFFSDEATGERGVVVSTQVFLNEGLLKGKLVDQATVKDYYVIGKGLVRQVHASTNGTLMKIVGQSFYGKDEEEHARDPDPQPDTEAQYPGGIEGLAKFLQQNVQYPRKARWKEAQGSVFVGFTIDKNGHLNDFVVVKGIHADCDTEALRVMSIMPDWNPAKKNGIAVESKFVLPVKFKLPNN